MPEISKHEPGSFSWVELASPDAAKAKSFYGSLFGWSFVDSPAGPGMTYTRFQLRDKDVAALFEQPAEQRSQGVPPHWTSYVTVESADRAAARVKELGGSVLMEPFDVMNHGRMAVCSDPTGAAFAIWEPRDHSGVQVRDEPATLCWNELATRDTAAAAKFYTALLGWKAKEDAGGYTEWYVGDKAVAGMMAVAPEWGDVPSHWTPYFLVADCDASAQQAQELGGQLLVAPLDIPKVGRFSMVLDPQGAAFAIVKLG